MTDGRETGWISEWLHSAVPVPAHLPLPPNRRYRLSKLRQGREATAPVESRGFGSNEVVRELISRRRI